MAGFAAPPFHPILTDAGAGPTLTNPILALLIGFSSFLGRILSAIRKRTNFLFRLTVEKNGQGRFLKWQDQWISKRPTASITAQVTP